jgi:hypothetical protein
MAAIPAAAVVRLMSGTLMVPSVFRLKLVRAELASAPRIVPEKLAAVMAVADHAVLVPRPILAMVPLASVLRTAPVGLADLIRFAESVVEPVPRRRLVAAERVWLASPYLAVAMLVDITILVFLLKRRHRGTRRGKGGMALK